ncbi:MAG: hypothetical protein EU541_00560 [Promethearchaeota archaeon]|nr:MAG: hypothetical protein EU541_00560 [Candidatus Lokiarchaeota archaeon]
MNKRNFKFSIKKKKSPKKKVIVLCIGLLFINLVVIGGLLIHNPYLNGIGLVQEDKNAPYFIDKINTQGADISLLQDPYTANFNDTWQFFESNYQSDLGYEIQTYFREGSADGTIINSLVYSLDNLLLYNTLLKSINDYDYSQILEKYLDLKNTDLWYEGSDQLDYGFVESIDNITGDVNNYNRYLIDNLYPIFLLGDNIKSSTGQSYVDELEDIFLLINSSRFYDTSSNIFYHYNSSTGDIYTRDNLYAILGNLLLNQTDRLDNEIQIRAGELANETMETLSNTYWDATNLGYYYSDSNNSKNLETNALGIITLIEYWKWTNNSEYLNNAISLFNKINSTLWYEFAGNGAYLNWSTQNWGSNITDIADLKANAIMLQACVSLFEVSGNITYYDLVKELYNTFENEFYDNSYNSYAKSKSISTGINNNKNLLYNLRISEAYLSALEVYENSSLSSIFNKSTPVPEFIFNQETLKLTTNYTYNSIYSSYGISDASLTYTLRYPNGTIIDTQEFATDENGTHTFTYYISSDLPVGEDYSITIFANASFHKFVNITKFFDIIGGIKYESGLEDETEYYQGTTQNITFILNNTRNNDINLTYSIKADSILIQNPKLVFLNTSGLNNITANFTIKNEAAPGNYSFHFLLKNGSITFLDYVKVIEIKNALEITNLIYDSEVVKGDIAQINLTATNFLQNESQSFNLSISGDYIDNIQNQEYQLSPYEIKIISHICNISNNIDSDTIQVEIDVSKGNESYYTKSLTLQVVDKLEIIDCSFSQSVAQATSAYLILVVKNNMETSQEYTLYINNLKITGSLNPGENRIVKSVVPTINPYDFSTKTYSIRLYDQQNNEIYRNSFKVNIELSVMLLVLCYILPIMVPIAIVIYFKNKQVKIDRLRKSGNKR